MTKRFELKMNFLNGHVNIVDWVESEQKDAICVFNDLGVLPFSSAPSVCNLLNQFNDENEWLKKENEQLKLSSTMYYNLFKELQRQMQGIKSIYDLDSKDFEDLIELSKGNVFDDEIGWVHLPIKEL